MKTKDQFYVRDIHLAGVLAGRIYKTLIETGNMRISDIKDLLAAHTIDFIEEDENLDLFYLFSPKQVVTKVVEGRTPAVLFEINHNEIMFGECKENLDINSSYPLEALKLENQMLKRKLNQLKAGLAPVTEQPAIYVNPMEELRIRNIKACMNAMYGVGAVCLPDACATLQQKERKKCDGRKEEI